MSLLIITNIDEGTKSGEGWPFRILGRAVATLESVCRTLLQLIFWLVLFPLKDFAESAENSCSDPVFAVIKASREIDQTLHTRDQYRFPRLCEIRR